MNHAFPEGKLRDLFMFKEELAFSTEYGVYFPKQGEIERDTRQSPMVGTAGTPCEFSFCAAPVGLS